MDIVFVYLAISIMCAYLMRQLVFSNHGRATVSSVILGAVPTEVLVLATLLTTEQLITVSVAGSTFSLADQYGFETLKNNLYVFVNNASFGILILALFASSFNIRRYNKIQLEDALIPVCLISISHALIGLQLFDPYSFDYSYRSSDTGGSRFFVPLVPLAILHFVKSASRRIGEFPMKQAWP